MSLWEHQISSVGRAEAANVTRLVEKETDGSIQRAGGGKNGEGNMAQSRVRMSRESQLKMPPRWGWVKEGEN